MQLSDESLIQLGAAILENPTNPRYADKLESSKVLGALAQWFIDKMSSGLPWRINNLLRQPYAFGLLNAIMGNRFTPSHLLADIYSILSRSSYRDCNYLLYTLAKNPATPSDVLSALGSSRYPTYIRSAVAGNPNTTPATLISLSTSPSKYIRCSLATNPATPENVLVHLANSTSAPVLEALAGNPRISETVISTLLSNPYSGTNTLTNLLANTALSQELFDRLVTTMLQSFRSDRIYLPSVRAFIKGWREISLIHKLQLAILQCPRLGATLDDVISLLRDLPTDKLHIGGLNVLSAKRAIVNNPRVPDDYLFELMFDENKDIRRAAAEVAQARHLATISDVPKERR